MTLPEVPKPDMGTEGIKPVPCSYLMGTGYYERDGVLLHDLVHRTPKPSTLRSNRVQA